MSKNSENSCGWLRLNKLDDLGKPIDRSNKERSVSLLPAYFSRHAAGASGRSWLLLFGGDSIPLRSSAAPTAKTLRPCLFFYTSMMRRLRVRRSRRPLFPRERVLFFRAKKSLKRLSFQIRDNRLTHSFWISFHVEMVFRGGLCSRIIEREI